MHKKLTSLATKQDEIISKLSHLSLKDEDKMKEQLAIFSASLGDLSNDNGKILEELYNLKESVTALRDLKSDLSDYDEESYNGKIVEAAVVVYLFIVLYFYFSRR